MKTGIRSFSLAYQDFHDTIKMHILPGMSICEIGGGAHPLILDEQIVEMGLNYTIVDPDESELKKAQTVANKICMTLDDMVKKYTDKYDLVISRMVLEHVENPSRFHKSILGILNPGGKAIHFFASLYGIPSLVNRFLPESWGARILSILGNRELENDPKYKAYYKQCFGPNKKSIDFFTRLGFNINKYYGYVGHSYGKHIYFLRGLEKAYNWLLYKTKCRLLNTLSLIVLSKPNQ